jgi:hypothetical protein
VRRLLLVLALVVGGLSSTAAASSPDSSQNCTPAIAPRVCLYIYGTGLHVDKFNVQFSAGAQGGTIVVKFMVRQGGVNGAIIKISGNKTYALDGQWHGWDFPSGANFPNNTVICGEVAHVAGPDYSGNRPCSTIHT